MELMRGQKLFEALENVCGFIALESDMDEIINAITEDNPRLKDIDDLPVSPVEIWHKAKELNGMDFTTWYRQQFPT